MFSKKKKLTEHRESVWENIGEASDCDGFVVNQKFLGYSQTGSQSAACPRILFPTSRSLENISLVLALAAKHVSTAVRTVRLLSCQPDFDGKC